MGRETIRCVWLSLVVLGLGEVLADSSANAGDRAYYVAFVEIDPPGIEEPPEGVADSFLSTLLACDTMPLEACKRERQVGGDNDTGGFVALVALPPSVSQALLSRVIQRDRGARRELAAALESTAIDAIITLEYSGRGDVVVSTLTGSSRRLARASRPLLDGGLQERDERFLMRRAMQPVIRRFVP